MSKKSDKSQEVAEFILEDLLVEKNTLIKLQSKLLNQLNNLEENSLYDRTIKSCLDAIEDRIKEINCIINY